MDNTSSGARTPQNLVPSRLLESQPLRGPTSRPGRFVHARGLRVVRWYAPSLTDPEGDPARLVAVVPFSAGGERFDGVAVDVDVNQAAAEIGAVGASVYEFRITPAGSLTGIGTASAEGFRDRVLSG